MVRLVRDLGIATVAEGIELADEATVCGQLGFELAQGYYFGRPALADAMATLKKGNAEDAENAEGRRNNIPSLLRDLRRLCWVSKKD